MSEATIRIIRDNSRPKVRIIRTPHDSWAWNLHTHSKFSANDALPEVKTIVAQAKAMGQPAIGLTDHGNMAGSVQLYTEAARHGIKAFPGTELYVVGDRTDKKAKRHHMCVVAYTTEGYSNLVRLNTLATENFHFKPLLDLADITGAADAGLLKGVAATSGCYFSLASQAMIRQGPDSAKAILGLMDKSFDRFYVELQNHNIDHGVCAVCGQDYPAGETSCPDHPDAFQWNDDLLADRMWMLADSMGIPVVLTQDAHYVHPEDKPVHETLKRLVAFGPEGDDAVFPGDGFHLADDTWFAAHHPWHRMDAGRAGLADLLGAHDLSIPQLDHYHYNIPFTVPDPLGVLTEKCSTALGIDAKESYWERLQEELDVIKDTGMAGYLVLVAEVTDWCRANRIFYQARGSASGSLVCYLMGITQADPLKWGLRYERFISRDRTKPPDIDLDVENDRRADVMEWLSSRFAIHQIGTWLNYTLAGEKEQAEKGVEIGSGSIRVRYYSRQRAQGLEPVPWEQVPTADKDDLYALARYKPLSSYGVHAAGLVVTSSAQEYDSLVPLMKVASSKTMVSQYEMGDIEALGLVKLDLLGLKTLSVLHRCMDNLGRDVFDGLGWIPLNDELTFRSIAKGETDGVFQLEGGSARRGMRDLKPTKVADVIAAMALFRPATMKSGATESYIERKHKRQEVPVRHEIIQANTKHTYGIMLYQEQVIAILRDLGMTPDDLTAFLKAVKASQQDEKLKAANTIATYRQHVFEMATGVGMSELDFIWLWSAIEGFSEYGFNQAHATAYGLTAYYCAYLSVHHPLEFHTALLQVAAGTDKEAGYVTAARNKGLRLHRADVNYSGVSYAMHPKRRGIVRGLLAIKGIGAKAAEAIVTARGEVPFASLEDFAKRVNTRTVSGVKPYLESGLKDVGVLGKLVEAEAFDSLGEN